MIALIQAHPFETLAVLYVFSTIVGAMPEPLPGSRWYAFIYSVLHVFAGNALSFLKSKVPALPAGTLQVTDIQQVTKVPDTKEDGNGK